MQHNRTILLLVAAGLVLFFSSGLWLATAAPVNAQCGSQASSCKNCHEVQGQDSVNNDGTGWHQSHAFGDFCYICHAGNSQSIDKDEAHTNMVPPLSDIQASCQQCHLDDLEARAQVYATALGVEIGGVAEPASPEAEPTTTDPASSEAVASVPVVTELDVDDPNLVDYAQRYNEIVLGKRPVNWGNVILIVMIGILLVGGGGFVIINEKLVKVSFGDTKTIEGEYPGDVVDMLPSIAGLKPQTRKNLKNILDNPRKSEKVLSLIGEIVSDEKMEE